MNQTLKRTIEKAKAAQVPADVIKRNIEKAKGAGAEAFIENRYEGIGPGGSTVIVETLSDNSMRAQAEIKSCFNKSHFNFTKAGSVSYQYENNGILCYEGTEDEALEILLMADVDVKETETDENYITVYTAPSDLFKAKDAIEAAKGETNFEILETKLLPAEYVTLNEEDKAMFQRLLTLLDEVDDVQQVYHNVDNI